MAEKTKSTQEELPLHEVVLELMFEFSKEKPAELSVSDVFWKISDPSLSEIQIKEVLNWLVHERRVEKFGDKYSLDRFEFLGKRNRDNAETSPKGGTSKESGEPIPLHESVLKIMYEASGDKPAELTANAIFWKGSDPAVSERNITEVLNWLVNQRKVDHFAGKYSLDRFEFLELKNAEKEEAKTVKKTPKPEKVSPPKPKAKPKPKPKPKPEVKEVSSAKPAVEPAPKQEPKKVAPPKAKAEPKVKAPIKQEEPVKVVAAPEVKPTPEVLPVEAKKKPLDNFSKGLIVLAAAIIIYMIYLFSTLMSNSTVPVNSSDIESEITQVEEQYDKLKVEQPKGTQKIEVLERRIELLKEITQKRSDQTAIYHQSFDAKAGQSSVLTRLIVSNLLLLLLLGIGVARRL